MSPRQVSTPDDSIRQSRRVATVAAALDLDESQVRRLVDEGELEAHGVGKRGLRIYLDSIQAYQERHQRPPRTALGAQPSKPAQVRRSASTRAHRAAMAALRADGILP